MSVACNNEDDDSAQITVGNVAFSEKFMSIKWSAYRITLLSLETSHGVRNLSPNVFIVQELISEFFLYNLELNQEYEFFETMIVLVEENGFSFLEENGYGRTKITNINYWNKILCQQKDIFLQIDSGWSDKCIDSTTMCVTSFVTKKRKFFYNVLSYSDSEIIRIHRAINFSVLSPCSINY
ncbi:hypothetical protein AGLY_004706 [Aphis glycines]|uniref:Uncharacterized protein n=1 Tax=Aphis glycines TaxID=307491 RepID=A0A6G0TV22_APHGL|nr:hypothetical protein AGLY_004706 [Aphis glycines]